MKKILGINTDFESLELEGLEEYGFSEKVSFLDYDMVVIDTSCIQYRYDKSSTSPYQNKRLLHEYDPHKIVEDFELIKKQSQQILKQGKNLFILMGNNEFCYIYTGDHEYSGTGRNARKTNIVKEFDTYSFLPVQINVTHISGEKINPCGNEMFTEFFKKTEGCFGYSSYFEIENSKPILKIPGTDLTIGAILPYENGNIVFLPSPYYEDEYRDEKEWKRFGGLYIESLSELNNKLSSKLDEYSLPKWVESIKILNENLEQEKLDKELKKLRELEEKIENQKQLIYEIQKYKTLITASGKVLEDIVKKVLQELGFELQPTELGRSDVIGKYDSFRTVIEIKGVTKSAAEKHAAQLEKWSALYIEETGEIPKPILVVNGFCETPLDKRKEEVFPHQMLKYCQSRGHVLVTTVQLLCMYIDIKQHPERTKEIIEELLNCVGIYNKYTDYGEFIKH